MEKVFAHIFSISNEKENDRRTAHPTHNGTKGKKYLKQSNAL
jgi:hypothetical protein